MRLVEIASKLDVGKPVDVELRRGTDIRTVKVTPVEANTLMAYTMTEPAITGQILTAPAVPAMPSAPFAPQVRLMARTNDGYFTNGYFVNNALNNVEMAPMNARLGAYFGTSSGVLVISTGVAASRSGNDAESITSVDRT